MACFFMEHVSAGNARRAVQAARVKSRRGVVHRSLSPHTWRPGITVPTPHIHLPSLAGYCLIFRHARMTQ